MKIAQIKLTSNTESAEINSALTPLHDISPNLLIVFADISFFSEPEQADKLIKQFPHATIIGCSTAGEICNTNVLDKQLIITAVQLNEQPKLATTTLINMADSFDAGTRIGEQLKSDSLKAVIVLGPGLAINGTALVEGMTQQLGKEIPITGGLAGDGGAFKQTWTLSNQGASANSIVAIGLTGDKLNFAHGSFGGWKPFGPARKVTHCEDNVLYELDGEPALNIYKRYLGDHAKDLPASGLLFPFEMISPNNEKVGLIRTILGTDETKGSLTLAGSIDPNGYLKLMHANPDSLIDGAEKAAEAAKAMHQQVNSDSLAILVSCVGRKLIMGDLAEEEVEAVADVFGSKATLTGFYSYGEISPFAPGVACHLHNQTMTVTWISEQS